MFNFEWAKRTHKGLRRWIMYMIKDKSRTGVEIMDAMEANLQGWWRPSPGSIYPLLDTMVREGILSRSEGKRYSLTEKGREEIERPFPWLGKESPSPRSVQGVLDLMSSYVSYLEDFAQSDREELSANSSRIRALRERLGKLGGD